MILCTVTLEKRSMSMRIINMAISISAISLAQKKNMIRQKFTTGLRYPLILHMEKLTLALATR